MRSARTSSGAWSCCPATGKLGASRTGGFAWPSWERDPRFDLDAHVRHATLPAPGDERQLLYWISDFYSHRLDRSRPLWEVALLDGLAGGGWALVWKTHHCMVDGVGSIGVVHLLLSQSQTSSMRQGRTPRRCPSPARRTINGYRVLQTSSAGRPASGGRPRARARTRCCIRGRRWSARTLWSTCSSATS